ncbi:MAG: hypothetical protein ACLPN1_14230 [Dissulfurispiraceae bacterium]
MEQSSAWNEKRGCVLFEVADGALLGPNRAQLLRLISQGVSVETASALVGIGVEHALDLITRMNESAAQPLVELDCMGNSTPCLTKAGEKALADYDEAFNEWRRQAVRDSHVRVIRYEVRSEL